MYISFMYGDISNPSDFAIINNYILLYTEQWYEL